MQSLRERIEEIAAVVALEGGDLYEVRRGRTAVVIHGLGPRSGQLATWTTEGGRIPGGCWHANDRFRRSALGQALGLSAE